MSTSALIPAASDNVELGTLTAATPAELVAAATQMADVLADVIERQKLYTPIQGRKHVRVEGWTTLATMLGCTVREVSNESHQGEMGGQIYTAVVELVRMRDQAVIGRASSECGDEAPWNQRPLYARRSMAATRATGKVCRLCFSWIMTLAGFDPTPEEEMPPAQEVPLERVVQARPAQARPAPAAVRSQDGSPKERLLWARMKARMRTLQRPGDEADDALHEIIDRFGFQHVPDAAAADQATLDAILRAIDTWSAPGSEVI